MKRVVLGTRGSKLAQWQTRHVEQQLLARQPDVEIRTQIIASDGDLDTDSTMSSFGETGVFVRRLEQALLEGKIDAAVHSMKDLPTVQPDGLCITAVPHRHDARDALLSMEGWTLDTLPRGTRVATGSPRRRALLLHARPDLDVVAIRGNVDTRVMLLKEGRVAALVLAVAGVERLGIEGVEVQPLEPSVCLPAVGQGALAVESRVDDEATRSVLGGLSHPPSVARVAAERAFLHQLGGGCLAPAAAYARCDGLSIDLEAVVAGTDGSSLLLERESGPAKEAERIGVRLAERLLVAGAERILRESRRRTAR